VLVLEYFQIPYKGEFYDIFNSTYVPPDRLKGHLYPMLQPDPNDPGFIIDESLAICEYLAESYPDRELWPKDVKLRALARRGADARRVRRASKHLPHSLHCQIYGQNTHH
jgi:glutathione S-transferase